MNTTRSLTASAEAYQAIGDSENANRCHTLIRECRMMDALFGPGASSGLAHVNIEASQLAIRAAEKLEAYNRKDAA